MAVFRLPGFSKIAEVRDAVSEGIRERGECIISDLGSCVDSVSACRVAVGLDRVYLASDARSPNAKERMSVLNSG